jgi:hypothetical protein
MGFNICMIFQLMHCIICLYKLLKKPELALNRSTSAIPELDKLGYKIAQNMREAAVELGVQRDGPPDLLSRLAGVAEPVVRMFNSGPKATGLEDIPMTGFLEDGLGEEWWADLMSPLRWC